MFSQTAATLFCLNWGYDACTEIMIVGPWTGFIKAPSRHIYNFTRTCLRRPNLTLLFMVFILVLTCEIIQLVWRCEPIPRSCTCWLYCKHAVFKIYTFLMLSHGNMYIFMCRYLIWFVVDDYYPLFFFRVSILRSVYSRIPLSFWSTYLFISFYCLTLLVEEEK